MDNINDPYHITAGWIKNIFEFNRIFKGMVVSLSYCFSFAGAKLVDSGIDL